MSRQTTWVVTGALSILALGGGVVVSSTAGEERLDGLGPALELNADPARSLETDQKSHHGAPGSALSDRLGAESATSAEPTQSPPSPQTPDAGPDSADEPTTVAPPPVTVYEPTLSSASAWTPPSVPSPSTWSPPSTPSS